MWQAAVMLRESNSTPWTEVRLVCADSNYSFMYFKLTNTQTLSIPQYLLHFIENLWSQVNKMHSVNNGHSGFIHKCSVLTETKVYSLCLAFSKRSCILPVASSTLTWICLRENRYLHNFSDSSFGGLLCVQPAEQHGLKENVPPHGLGSQSFNTGLIEMCIIYICA